MRRARTSRSRRQFVLMAVFATLGLIPVGSPGAIQEVSTAQELLDRGRAAHGGGRLEEALDLYEQALAQFRRDEDDTGAAVCLNNSSVIHHFHGDHGTAAELAEEAVRLRTRLGNRVLAGRSRTNAGRALLGLGRRADAERNFLAALEDARSGNNARDEVVTRINLAVLDLAAGRYGDALVHLRHGLDLVERSAGESWTRHQQIILLNNRGVVYERIGEYERALQDYEVIEGILGDDGNVVPVLINVATIHRNLGNADAALAKLQLADETLGTATSPARRASLLSNIGLVLHLNLGRLDEARQKLEQALDLALDASDRYESMRVGNALGRLYMDLDLPQKAAHTFLEVLEKVYSAAALEPAWEAHEGMARLLAAQGNRDGALRALRTAAALVEGTRQNLVPEFAPRRLLSDRLGLFALYADLQADGERTADLREALTATERARARLLLVRRVRTGDPLLDDATASRDLLALSSAAARTYSIPDAAAIAAWKTLEQHWRNDRDPPLPATIPPGEAWISYWIQGEQPRVFWLVGDEIGSARLPSQRTISEQSAAWRDSLRAEDRTREQKLGAALFAAVVQPVLAALPADISRLRMVPDADLWRVPLDALPLPGGDAGVTTGQRLLERYAITLLPALSYAGASVPVVGTGAFNYAYFGPPAPSPGDRFEAWRQHLPALPEADNEAKALQRALGSGGVVWQDASATEANFRDAAAGKLDVLHVATHATFDAIDTGRTGIVFTRPAEKHPDPDNDGFLSLPEILDVDLDVRLTLLSACSGALGEELPGEGLESLAAALVESGSNTVVASLWDVEDLPARAFVEQIYHHLGEGKKISAAVRQAKMSLMKATGPLAEPARWAPWVVIGNGDWHLERRNNVPLLVALCGLAATVLAIGAGLLVSRSRRQRLRGA